MTKINFPNPPSIKPLKDYPDGQFFIVKGDISKFLVVKARCSQDLTTLINVESGNRYVANLREMEAFLKEGNFTLFPVDVEINVL